MKGSATQTVGMTRHKATILCDFNFSTSTIIDDSFQFVDCTDVDFEQLARDVRAGVLDIQHSKVVIAIGNQAAMDNFTNVVSVTTMLVNALVDRLGCINVQIWVLSVIPRPDAAPEVVNIIRKQNKGLFKSVRALVRRCKYPVEFITAHKWFLKRVQYPDGDIQVEVDKMYYVRGTQHLNKQGLEHLYLLVAKQVRLWNVQYEWQEMPLVLKRMVKKRRVLHPLQTQNII